MISLLRKFLADEHGATSIEYGLIAAIICIGLISSLTGLAPKLNNHHNNVVANLT